MQILQQFNRKTHEGELRQSSVVLNFRTTATDSKPYQQGKSGMNVKGQGE